MRSWIERLRAALDDMSPRERLLVLGAAATLALCIVILGVVRPILGASAQASRRVAAAESELEVVRRLRAEYDEVNARLADVEARVRNVPDNKRIAILTTLEDMAKQAAVKVDSMEPRTSPASDEFEETKVQVSLKGVTLSQLVTYLHRIEDSKQVLSIKSLRIRTRGDKPELLDVTFSVSTFEPV